MFIEVWSAYHLHGESDNCGENSNGTVHPGGMLGKKGNTLAFEVLPFSRFENRNDRNFLRKPKIYRYFVNGHNTIPFLISVRKKYQYHLTEDFFIEISATKVSALGLKEYARYRQVVLLTECSLRLLAKRTLQRQCQGRQQIQILTHR